MSDALSASRKSLEAARQKALDDVARTDEEISTTETRLDLLRSQRALQAGKAEQLAEGIAALRKAAADGQD